MKLKGLPYNTKRIYTVAECQSGCKVYLPANSQGEAKRLKEFIQKFLDMQPPPPRITA